jgi:recombination protein RecA
VAATPTRMEMRDDVELDNYDMGRMALQVSKLFRRLVRFLFVNKVCLLCVNQTRTKFVRFGNPETTYGGKALKFYAWVRIRLGSTKVIEENGEEVGFLCHMKVVKNKVAPPLKTCKFPIYWERGIDKAMAVWEFAVDEGLFKRSKGAYRFDKKVITKKSFRKYYKHHKEEVDGLLRQSVAAHGG